MFKNEFINAEALQGYATPRCKVVLLSADKVLCTSNEMEWDRKNGTELLDDNYGDEEL